MKCEDWLGHVYIWLGICYIQLGHSNVRGGEDFRVDIKEDIEWDYRGDVRKYFKESKVV